MDFSGVHMHCLQTRMFVDSARTCLAAHSLQLRLPLQACVGSLARLVAHTSICRVGQPSLLAEIKGLRRLCVLAGERAWGLKC